MIKILRYKFSDFIVELYGHKPTSNDILIDRILRSMELSRNSAEHNKQFAEPPFTPSITEADIYVTALSTIIKWANERLNNGCDVKSAIKTVKLYTNHDVDKNLMLYLYATDISLENTVKQALKDKGYNMEEVCYNTAKSWWK